MLGYIPIDQKAISKQLMSNQPTILLSMSRASDRRLIRKNFPERYTIIEETETSPAELTYDLCITDLHSFKKHRKELLKIKKQALPIFLPLVLLVENTETLKYDPEIWTQVDDIIQVPLPIKMLNMRIKNQIRSRENSLEIARQNNKLRLLEKAVNSTDVGIVISDAQEENEPLIYANDGFIKLTGYDREEIIGKNCRFLQNGNRNQKATSDVAEFIKNGVSGRSIFRNYKKDGTPFWNELSIAPIKDEEGEVSHFIGIQNDVTDLVETQQDLKDEKNLLRLVTENSTDMISRHALDGTFLYITPSCEKLMGYTADELIGRNAYDFMHPDDVQRVDKAHKILHNNPTDAKTVTTTFRNRSKSGEYKWVESVSHASINPEDKSIVEIQINTRDISTRKQYEDELNEALNEKNVLLQEIHHRVKNNLAIISGLLQIQQFDSDDENHNRLLGNSVSRIKSMALIHEKLYRSNSLSHLDFEEYIEELVESIKTSQGNAQNITINIDSDSTKLNVNQAVPCALALNEIISNAIAHAFPTNEEGTICVQFKEDGDRLLVSIKDNGIGIPDSVLNNDKPSMGMTIIETLIRQLNAEKEISTDDGTEFKFSFTRQNVKGAHNRFM